MYKVDNATAVLSLPTPAAPGPNPNGYFQNDGAMGIDADWLNAIQDEFINLMADAGVSPSKTDRTQLNTAIRSIIATDINPGSYTNPLTMDLILYSIISSTSDVTFEPFAGSNLKLDGSVKIPEFNLTDYYGVKHAGDTDNLFYFYKTDTTYTDQYFTPTSSAGVPGSGIKLRGIAGIGDQGVVLLHGDTRKINAFVSTSISTSSLQIPAQEPIIDYFYERLIETTVIKDYVEAYIAPGSAPYNNIICGGKQTFYPTPVLGTPGYKILNGNYKLTAFNISFDQITLNSFNVRILVNGSSSFSATIGAGVYTYSHTFTGTRQPAGTTRTFSVQVQILPTTFAGTPKISFELVFDL